MKKEQWDSEAKAQVVTDEDEQVNQASALWARPKSEITEEQYHEFYKHVAHDFDAPLAYTHAKVEGRQEFTLLLYVPAAGAVRPVGPRAPPRRQALRAPRVHHGRRRAADAGLPALRARRGRLERPAAQRVARDPAAVQGRARRSASAAIKRVLAMLEELAEKETAKYATFWKTFGRVLKEGIPEDHANRDRLAKLLRFSSTHSAGRRADRLARRLRRPDEGRAGRPSTTSPPTAIAAARNSPHLEIFRKLGVEVLLLHDRIDEWVASSLHEFDGKPLQSAAAKDLDLSAIGGEAPDARGRDAVGRARAAARAHADGARRPGQRRAGRRRG